MDLLNIFLSRLPSVVGILVFVSGLGGFGKTLVLGRMISFLLLPSWKLRIRLLRLPGFWWSLINKMLTSAKPECLFSVDLSILLSLLTSLLLS